MFSELSTPKTQARAFSYFAFAGNIGIFLGPLIGGLAKPAEQYPSIFGNIQFFKDFPYLLPTMVAGGIAVVALVAVTVFIKEVSLISPDET
jgi:MFS family permease